MGVIRADYDPVKFAKIYEACGARAISVLTDRNLFQGSLDDLQKVAASVNLPVIRKDFILHEKMAHFNRERIPERVVHAKGTGAYGTFTVTHDITAILLVIGP